MASSSTEILDDSVPEIVYQCISIIDANSCRRDEQFVKCSLCHHFGKVFYCVDCVRNGDFTHSKKNCLVRFADKKPKKYKIDAEKAAILQRYELAFSKRKAIENLKLEIFKRKEKIQLLQESLKGSKDRQFKGQKKIHELKQSNAAFIANRTRFVEKLTQMARSLKHSTEVLQVEEQKLSTANKAVKKGTHQRSKELIMYIFPITKVAPCYLKGERQCVELDEAQKTTYVQGQWVITGSAEDMEYAIIESRIPVNGDYSAYTNWCSEHIQGISLDSLALTDKERFDAAYGISSALAYTAQLVGILAFYMDAHVPKKISFSDFCGHEPSRAKFFHRVAKLNTNVVNLCLTQKVDLSRIDVQRTLSNLLLFLELHSNGQSGPMSCEEQERLMESIESSLSRDLMSADESDSDDADAEYVHVSEDEEWFAAAQPEEHAQPPSLVSSVFSLWKAATGQK